MFRVDMWSASVLLASLLIVTGVSSSVNGSPLMIDGAISVDSPVEIIPNRVNETMVDIPGSFRVNAKNGADTYLVTSADLSISRGTWSATLSETHWDAVEEGRIYTFAVSVIIPSSSAVNENANYTLTLVFSNLLGTTDPMTASLKIDLKPMPGGDDDSDDGPDDPGNATTPSAGDPFPIWIIFVGGLVVLLAGGAVWAFRNLEVVREDDGARRIMMKERKRYDTEDRADSADREDQLR